MTTRTPNPARDPEALLAELSARVDVATGLERARSAVVGTIDDDGGRPGPAQRPSPRERSARRRRRTAAAAVATLTAVGAIGGVAAATGLTPEGLVLGWQLRTGGSLEPLPPPAATGETPNEALDRLAAAAAAAPEPGPDLGWVQVDWQSWNLEQGDDLPDVMLPRTRTGWVASDGTWRVLGSTDGAPAICREYPPPDVAGSERTPHVTDPADVVEVFLRDSYQGKPTAWAIADAYTDNAAVTGDADPETRAALLAALSDAGAEYLGRTTDRHGDVVDVISASWTSDGIRHERWLLIDPTDGGLSGWESIMHGPVILGSTTTVESSLALDDPTFVTQPPDVGVCLTMPPDG